MKSIKDIERLEKLIGQLKAFHAEIGQLAKKSPNDALNDFKLGLINKTISLANSVLGKEYIPFEGFSGFEKDDMPSNSDVTTMISQYLEEAERWRSRHVRYHHGNYVYFVNNEATDVKAAPPSWSRK